MQRLTFGSTVNLWSFTTELRSSCLEMKYFAASPGVLPNLFNGIMLFNPFTVFGNAGVGAGPVSQLTIPKLRTPIGSRVYVQSIVLDPSNLRAALTNAMIPTLE